MGGVRLASGPRNAGERFMSNVRGFQSAVCAALLLIGAAHSSVVAANQVLLQEGTATFSQVMGGGPYGPDQAIDGIFTNPCCDPIVNGWAIAPDSFIDPGSQTAVWETQSDVSAGALTFKMYFDHWNPQHLLGRFRFSVTTDDRSMFADGLSAGGDVDANWIVLTGATVRGPAGMTFTDLGDGSVLAGGVIPAQGIYEVDYLTGVSGITGVRLEALEYAGLPGPGGVGPGFFFNGNFILTEITVFAIPEPITTVTIDIKPGSDPNRINLCSKGAVPVAILGSDTFDVSNVNTESLRFADAAVKVVGKKNSKAQCSIKDVNSDVYVDLVCRFPTADIVEIDGESSTASVNGELLDGTGIEGTDSVSIVKDSCNPFAGR